jgi:hypothetical protein
MIVTVIKIVLTKNRKEYNIKAILGQVLKDKWKHKVMNWHHIRNIERQFIGEEVRFLWLSKGDSNQ